RRLGGDRERAMESTALLGIARRRVDDSRFLRPTFSGEQSHRAAFACELLRSVGICKMGWQASANRGRMGKGCLLYPGRKEDSGFSLGRCYGRCVEGKSF